MNLIRSVIRQKHGYVTTPGEKMRRTSSLPAITFCPESVAYVATAWEMSLPQFSTITSPTSGPKGGRLSVRTSVTAITPTTHTTEAP